MKGECPRRKAVELESACKAETLLTLEEPVYMKTAKVAGPRASVEDAKALVEQDEEAVEQKSGAIPRAQAAVKSVEEIVGEIARAMEELRENPDALETSMHSTTQKVAEEFDDAQEIVRKACTGASARLSKAFCEM